MSWKDNNYISTSSSSSYSDEPIIQLEQTKRQLDQNSLEIIISYKNMLQQKLYLCNDEIEKYSLETRLERVNDHLSIICQHKWIHDHIETGLEGELKQITYCEICELSDECVYSNDTKY